MLVSMSLLVSGVLTSSCLEHLLLGVAIPLNEDLLLFLVVGVPEVLEDDNSPLPWHPQWEEREL